MTNSASAKLIVWRHGTVGGVRQTVNLFFRASRFESYCLHHIFRLVSIMVITADCLSAYGSSILPRVASIAGRSSDPHGLISHSESGALPLPATSYIVESLCERISNPNCYGRSPSLSSQPKIWEIVACWCYVNDTIRRVGGKVQKWMTLNV